MLRLGQGGFTLHWVGNSPSKCIGARGPLEKPVKDICIPYLQVIGCVGALRLNERLLNAYWLILLGLLVGDVVVGGYWDGGRHGSIRRVSQL